MASRAPNEAVWLRCFEISDTLEKRFQTEIKDYLEAVLKERKKTKKGKGRAKKKVDNCLPGPSNRSEEPSPAFLLQQPAATSTIIEENKGNRIGRSRRGGTSHVPGPSTQSDESSPAFLLQQPAATSTIIEENKGKRNGRSKRVEPSQVPGPSSQQLSTIVEEISVASTRSQRSAAKRGAEKTKADINKKINVKLRNPGVPKNCIVYDPESSNISVHTEETAVKIVESQSLLSCSVVLERCDDLITQEELRKSSGINTGLPENVDNTSNELQSPLSSTRELRVSLNSECVVSIGRSHHIVCNPDGPTEIVNSKASTRDTILSASSKGKAVSSRSSRLENSLPLSTIKAKGCGLSNEKTTVEGVQVDINSIDEIMEVAPEPLVEAVSASASSVTVTNKAEEIEFVVPTVYTRPLRERVKNRKYCDDSSDSQSKLPVIVISSDSVDNSLNASISSKRVKKQNPDNRPVRESVKNIKYCDESSDIQSQSPVAVISSGSGDVSLIISSSNKRVKKQISEEDPKRVGKHSKIAESDNCVAKSVKTAAKDHSGNQAVDNCMKVQEKPPVKAVSKNSATSITSESFVSTVSVLNSTEQNEFVVPTTCVRPVREKVKNRKYFDSVSASQSTSTAIGSESTEDSLNTSSNSKRAKKRKSEEDLKRASKHLKVTDSDDGITKNIGKKPSKTRSCNPATFIDKPSGATLSVEELSDNERTRTRVLAKPTVSNIIIVDSDTKSKGNTVQQSDPPAQSTDSSTEVLQLPVEKTPPRMTRTRTREIKQRMKEKENDQAKDEKNNNELSANLYFNKCKDEGGIIGKENLNVHPITLQSSEKRFKTTPLAINNFIFSPSASHSSANKYKALMGGSSEKFQKNDGSASKFIQKETIALEKKRKLMQMNKEEVRRKREERVQKVLVQKEAVEREKREKLAKIQKDKEERERLLTENRRVKEDQILQKKQNTEAMLKEAEERRLKEEEAKMERIKKQEEEKKKLAEERVKQAEEAKKLHDKRLAMEAKEKIRLQKEVLMKNHMKADKLGLVDSYELTPGKDEMVPRPLKNANDYGISEGDSGDSTDDEKHPKKVIPKWAGKKKRWENLLNQNCVHTELTSTLFPLVLDGINAEELEQQFSCRQRNSSAVWHSPANLD